MVVEGNARKGDVLGAARIAGIMAAKRTHELIPLCHPLMLSSIAVDIATGPGPAGAARDRDGARGRARPAWRWRR